MKASQEIARNATERYEAELQNLRDKEEELNNSVCFFEEFWQQTLNDNILRFCKYADDMGKVINEREYVLEKGIAFSPIEVAQFIEVQTDFTAEGQAIVQNFTDLFVDLSSGERPKGEAFAAFLTGLVIDVAATAVKGYMAEQEAITRAKKYESEINTKIAEMKRTFSIYETFISHINELYNNIKRVADQTKKSLDALEPLVPDFREGEEYYMDIWKQSSLLIKTLGELTKISLINEAGDIDPEYYRIMDAEILTLTNER